jgi:hypothetical protein
MIADDLAVQEIGLVNPVDQRFFVPGCAGKMAQAMRVVCICWLDNIERKVKPTS